MGDCSADIYDAYLPAYWDGVARSSFHLRQDKPTITDIYYRHIVLSLINQLISHKPHRILKLDAYNEATQTQYGYHMIQDGQDLILVDISVGIARRAAERAAEKNVYNQTHIIVGDFRRLPLRNGCVDMSCSFGSIEHVPEYVRAFYEQVRVVRIGGDVLVGVPNMANLSLRVLSTKILHLIGLMRKMTNPEKHFLKPQLIAIAEKFGLSDIIFSGYHLFPKQLRWLDLWMESTGRNPLPRSRLFRWLLKTFTALEMAHPSTRNLAEMIVVKGVRRVGRGREQRSLSCGVASIRL
ncbi:MAG: methyltransferase domain-containing protein [Nitrososphaerota archaeon]